MKKPGKFVPLRHTDPEWGYARKSTTMKRGWSPDAKYMRLFREAIAARDAAKPAPEPVEKPKTTRTHTVVPTIKRSK